MPTDGETIIQIHQPAGPRTIMANLGNFQHTRSDRRIHPPPSMRTYTGQSLLSSVSKRVSTRNTFLFRRDDGLFGFKHTNLLGFISLPAVFFEFSDPFRQLRQASEPGKLLLEL